MLRRLYGDGELSVTTVVIVCNGCTDDTADRARETLGTFEHRATVIDRPEPGKARAIRTAEETLPPGPRLFLDADAGCDGTTARALLAAVDSHRRSATTSAVAVPHRMIVTDTIRNPLVRAYYYGLGRACPGCRPCRTAEPRTRWRGSCARRKGRFLT